jgi:glycosyltransferase involved in cell wall biosynthesis
MRLETDLEPGLRRDFGTQPGASALRCLWISRHLPYPLDSGAKVYSAKLAESLAASGAYVRFLGFGDATLCPSLERMDWRGVRGERRGQMASLVSTLPLAASMDATPEYRYLLGHELTEHWDAIVIDGYGSGWALGACVRYRDACVSPPVLTHVSHNHEEVLWRAMAREGSGSLAKRAALWQNYRKVRALERRIVREVDLLTAITAEDAQALGSLSKAREIVTLTPGHAGAVAPPRLLTGETPRRIAIVGSFQWVVKQENLRRFIAAADRILADHSIALDIVGDVPAELREELAPQCRATHFHGFVADVAPYLARARMAVVPEVIGGGFKLKFLDYVFARVPVATLSCAAAGLPIALRNAMVARDELPELVGAIVAGIDDLESLNEKQQRAFECAETLYRWCDRGDELRHALVRMRFGGERTVAA